MSVPPVHIQVNRPLPETGPPAALDINPRVTSVEVETGPGGFVGLRVGMFAPDANRPLVRAALPRPQEVPEKAHIAARIGSHVIHEGIRQQRSIDGTGFTAAGYGVVAGAWGRIEVGTDDTPVETQKIAAAAIQAVPWWTLGEVPDPAIPSYRSWSEARMPSDQVLDALCREGAGGIPWRFTVWEDRVARVTEQRLDGAPDYRLAYDPETMDIQEEDAEVADAVRASYTDAAGRRRDTAWVYRDGVRPSDSHLRRVEITGGGPPATLMQFLQTWMAQHSAPRLVGSISLTGWRGLTLPSGVEVPGYLVRYGQVIEIEGYGRAQVVRTTYNHFTGATQIQLDAPSLETLQGVLDQLLATDAAVRSGRDPVTGNRV